jgi:uncharacterized protein YjgD (DUF1641 family)
MATPITTPLDAAAAPDEMQRLVVALRDILTDSMVERFAATAEGALAVVDRLNEPETRDAVHMLIDRLTEMHRIGALDTLFETALLLHAMRSAATDSIVDRLFSFVEQTANTLGSDAMAACADDVLRSLEGAVAATPKEPKSGGVFSTLALLSKPESQQSLQFLLNFGNALRRSQEKTR